MRIISSVFDKSTGYIFAGTNRGTVFKLTSGLKIIASSEPSYNISYLFALNVDESFVYGRDNCGKLARWTKASLFLDKQVDLGAWAQPNYALVPNACHGLFINAGYLYTSLPTGELAIFNKSDLNLEKIIDHGNKALFESICFDNPKKHFATDFSGFLYQGNVDEKLEIISRASLGAIHKLDLDKLHNRYWFTDDYHGGIGLFNENNPAIFDRIVLTNDDTEYLAFDETHEHILVACFDRYIYKLRNEKQPTVLKKLGPYNYQLTFVEWINADTGLALTEAGDLFTFSVDTGEIEQIIKGADCVWDLRPSQKTPNLFFTAFESGNIAKIKFETNCGLEVVMKKQLDYGMVRRIVPLMGDQTLVLSTSGFIAKLDENFEKIWEFKTKPLLRDIAVCDQKVIFCGETGELSCLSLKEGTLLWTKNLQNPLWSVFCDDSKDSFIVSSRTLNLNGEKERATIKNAPVFFGSLNDGSIFRTEYVFGNIKKIRSIDDEHILINGNGNIQTSLVKKNDLSMERIWGDLQLNTAEAALLHPKTGHVYTTTYGFQLNTYDHSGEILESDFPFEDYATTLSFFGDDYIIAAGRGAFISVFKLKENLPSLAFTRRF